MPDTIYAVESTATLTGKAEKVTYAYDDLGRIIERTVYLNVANDAKKVTTYTYKDGGHGAGSTSTLLASITTDGVTYAYTYDKVERITAITKSGALYESYEYDALSQLQKVTKADGTYYEYAYDNGGNLTEVKKNGTVIHAYTYGNTAWKDQLTAFDSGTITYDAQGNPLTYYDGAAMTWTNGRNLSSITRNGNTVAFGYASDGSRISKTVNGVTTTYYYVGGRLYGELTGNNKLIYLYDNTDSPYGYIYNDTSYYYERNAQGDVVGLYYQNGTKIANYTYDAWGNILSITNQYGEDVTSQPRHQGNLNPIRYRGYHYDAEIGLYWLATRFYDPNLGRFVNADGVVAGNSDSVQGYNQYAYCFNNPVNTADSSGCWPEWLKGIKQCVEKIIDEFISKAREILTVEYDVPIYNQGSTSMCFAYVQAMIYDYKAGITRTQSEADKRAQEISTAYHQQHTENWDGNWNMGGYPADGIQLESTGAFSLYRALLQHGPLYASYGCYENGKRISGHAIVVTGINLFDGCVYTVNPWGFSAKQPYEEFINAFVGAPGENWKLDTCFYFN